MFPRFVLIRSGARVFSTSATATSPKRRWSRSKKLAVAVAVGVGASAAIYVTDLAVNDDFDSFTEKFRSRLPASERKDRPHVVILGAGWGALNMLRKLQTDQFNVTVVAPTNYFLFTPLLPSTTSGMVETRSIMEPIRRYCSRSNAQEARFIEVECTRIDPATNTVHCVDNSFVKGEVSEFDLKYDHLVVAVGAETATFNIPGVKENTLFMKSVEDSVAIRNRVMDCFETAVIPGQSAAEVARLLHFVVVGGGPAGVEYAAELHDFLERDLKKNFPGIADKVRITLVEALPHILNMFDAKIISYVESKFKNTPSLELWTKSAVQAVEPKLAKIKTEDGSVHDVPFGCMVWATGNAPRKVVTDLIAQLGPKDQPVRRALSVDDYFRVNGTKNIWALGDCSVTKANYPATAQVASQEGRYLGRLFNRLVLPMDADKRNGSHDALDKALAQLPPFQYHHFGSFAYVGDHQAVAEWRGQNHSSVTSQGFSTYVVWRSVYMSKLLSVRNRVLVAFDWFKTSVFGRDVSRG